jgi:hypothetical protein
MFDVPIQRQFCRAKDIAISDLDIGKEVFLRCHTVFGFLTICWVRRCVLEAFLEGGFELERTVWKDQTVQSFVFAFGR